MVLIVLLFFYHWIVHFYYCICHRIIYCTVFVPWGPLIGICTPYTFNYTGTTALHIHDKSIKQWLISPLWEVPVAVSHLFSFTVYARAWWSAFDGFDCFAFFLSLNCSFLLLYMSSNHLLYCIICPLRAPDWYMHPLFLKYATKVKLSTEKRLFKISIFSQLKVQKFFWKEDKDWKLTLNLLISSNNVVLASKKWVWCDSPRQETKKKTTLK
jgi:hypothetical protein